MRKTAIIFFLTTALFLVLGHSVFPHNHIDGVCCAHCISIKKKLSLTDIIQNSLSQDLGTNHLEEYKHRQLLGFNFTNVSIDFVNADDSLSCFNFLLENDSCVFSHALNAQFREGPTGSRAPPIIC